MTTEAAVPKAEPAASARASIFKRRKHLMQAVLVLVTLALGLVTAEVLLRLTWADPKAERPVGEDYGLYVRLQQPNSSAVNDLTGLYAGAGKVPFRTDANGAVLGPHHPGLPLVHFYGGSTTENGVVPEGHRWVDLIQGVDARNFGLAHNNLINDYANFKYNLEHLPPPTEAYFMEAANDLVFSALTPAQLNDKPTKQPSKIRIYVYDFGRELLDHLQVSSKPLRDYWRADPYLNAQRHLTWLSDADFNTYVATVLTPTLEHRERVIRAIAALGRQHHVKITFLTQPNDYRPDFHAYEGYDLRTYPRLNGKMFTMQQSATLIRLTNESTMATASEEGASVIDVAKAFESQDPTPLFYDSFHYTPAGSQLFAGVVNRARATKAFAATAPPARPRDH
ncbi:MAG TPA: hypothetical protein VGG29_00410 [Caulobacteraceae bacterium]